MSVDSLTAILATQRSNAALPNWVLALLLLGWFLVIVLLIVRAREFKAYSQDFPTHGATVLVALAGIMATTPIVLSRMALGLPEVDGTGNWLTFLAALAGVTGLMLGAKRFSDPAYVAAKGEADAARAAAKTGTFPVPQVNADVANVNVNTQPPKPAATAQVPAKSAAPGLATAAAIHETKAQTAALPDVPGEGD